MPLNFSVVHVKDHETVTTSPFDKKKWHPITEALIHKTMSIDIGEIKESNIDEWWFRVRLLQALDGPELRYDKGQVYITKKDIEMHVGLSTNVTTRSRTYWLKRILDLKSLDRISPVLQDKSGHEICAELAAKVKASCSECKGTGWLGHGMGGDTCHACNGTGKANGKETV